MGWLEIEGDVCVVTGALGGMGREICREFARNGANVALLDLDGKACAEAARGLAEEFGVNAIGIGANSTDEQSVQAAVDQIMDTFGKVNSLVNTAGILRFAPMEDLPLEEWQKVIDVDLTGYFLTSQRFGREMIRQRSGRLVHISSIMSYFPETYSGAYSPAKAAVNQLSQMLAVEWGPYGIRSNCVVPSFVKTPMTEYYYRDPAVESERSRLTALKRIGEASDVANAVLFLASPRSGDTTGTEIKVDGGFSKMMGDLTPKQGGRRGYALEWMREQGIPSWSEESGIPYPAY